MVYVRHIKPVFDFCMAVMLIVTTLPLLLFLLISGTAAFGNPIFVQRRHGIGKTSFPLLKFRSMLAGKGLEDEERLTRYGRLIRKYSLDELPQLFNILAGQMSIVGPRPLPVEYAQKMNEVQRRRFSVKPGLTGLVQVNGRNSLSWEEKFGFDIYYLNQVSLKTDVWIIFRTIPAWWFGEGVSHPGYVTMPVFEGERHTS